MNLPNKLSLMRIFMVPIFMVFFYLPFAWAPWVAFGVFVLAACTDFLDGYIARKYNMVTDLGKLLDPIADKMLVCFALFAVISTNVLANGTSTDNWTFIFLAIGGAVIIARELLISAVRQIAASKGKIIQANVFGKIKTIVQDIALPALIILQANKFESIIAVEFYNVLWWIAVVIFAIAVVLTIMSGVIYMVQNKSVFSED